MKNFLPLFLLLAASSCGTVRTLPTVSDSTRVEVRTETVTSTDTVFVSLPQIVERVAVLDTSSVLENEFAKSEASVSAGVLSHSLEVKPVRRPVAVETKTVYRDSLVYVDRAVTETVEVEKPLTRWQRLRLDAGTAALILIVIAMLYLFYRLFNPKLKNL